MKLPEQLPTDPDELERLYDASLQDDEELDEADFQRLINARLAGWGIDPKNMTADQIFGAMAESMNRMLLNLQAAMSEAPDDESAQQVNEIIKAAEELRHQIDTAMQTAADNPTDETPPDRSD